MATARFFPHRVATGGIGLRLLETPQGTTIRPDGVVDAYSDEPASVTLKLELGVDEGALGAALAEGANPDQELEVLIVTRGIAGRSRRGTRIPSPFDTKTYELTLDRATWAGEVRVSTLAVRSCPGGPGFPYASDKGAILAESETIRVQFDESEPPPGRALEVEWRDFRADPALEDDHLFALQPVPGKPPKILLNNSVNNARAVLNSKGRRGAKYRIRQATFHEIAHQGWSTILARLFDRLRDVVETAVDGGGELPTPEDALSNLVGWEATVLKDWARHLFPESGDRNAALHQLMEALADNRTEDLLVFRTCRAIQGRFATYSSFEGLVRDANQFTLEGT
jgi:hypothetical protein